MIIGKYAREAGYIVCSVCKEIVFKLEPTQFLCSSVVCWRRYHRIKRYMDNHKQIRELWRVKKVKPNKCMLCQEKIEQGHKLRLICDNRECVKRYARVRRQIETQGGNK